MGFVQSLISYTFIRFVITCHHCNHCLEYFLHIALAQATFDMAIELPGHYLDRKVKLGTWSNVPKGAIVMVWTKLSFASNNFAIPKSLTWPTISSSRRTLLGLASQ